MKFANSYAAYAAMRSRSAVFNNRFIVVQPNYNPDDPTTFELNPAESARKIREERDKAALEREDRMQLVLVRQQIQAQEISTLKDSLRKRLDLLKKYAKLASTLPENQRSSFQASLTKVMTSVYNDSDQLYELLKTCGKAAKMGDPNMDAETEVKTMLFEIISNFENTFLYDSLKAAITTHLISLFQKQMTSIHGNSSFKRPRGEQSTFYPKRSKNQFQIDNRSKKVILKNLPPDTKEEDVVNSLTGYFGVKSITKDGSQAVIEFDQPWQTKKPIQQGLIIRKMVSIRERYYVKKIHPQLFYNKEYYDC